MTHQAALFSRRVAVGDHSPPGEVAYLGYRRIPVVVTDGAVAHQITFPESQQDEPVEVRCVAVLDDAEIVVGVADMRGDWVCRGQVVTA